MEILDFTEYTPGNASATAIDTSKDIVGIQKATPANQQASMQLAAPATANKMFNLEAEPEDTFNYDVASTAIGAQRPQLRSQIAVDQEKLAKAVYASYYKNYTNNVSFMDNVLSLFDDGAQQDLVDKSTQVLDEIKTNLASMGIAMDHRDDKLYYYDKDGVEYDITPSFGTEFWNMLKFNTGELLGTTAAAIALGSKAAKLSPIVQAKAAGVAGETIAGALGAMSAYIASAGGAALGELVDEAMLQQLGKYEGEKLVADNTAAQIIKNSIEAGALDILAGTVLDLGIMGYKAAKPYIQDTAAYKVTAAAAKATGDAVKYNFATKEGLTKTGISTLVGAGVGSVTGPVGGLVASGLTRYTLGKLGAKEGAEAGAKSSIKEKATGLIDKAQDKVNKYTGGLLESDYQYLKSYFNKADQATLDRLSKALEAEGVNLTGSTRDQEILKIMLTQPGTAKYYNNIAAVEKGFPAKHLSELIQARSNAMATTIRNLANEDDIPTILRSISEGQNAVRSLYDLLGTKSSNFKSTKITFKLGDSAGFLAGYNKVIKDLLGSNPPSLATPGADVAKGFNLASSTNPLIRSAINPPAATKAIAKANKAAGTTFDIEVSLKDLLAAKYDYSSIDKKSLTPDAINRIKREEAMIDSYIKAFVDENIKLGNFTKQDATELLNGIKAAQEQMTKYHELKTNFIYKALTKEDATPDKIATELFKAAQSVDSMSDTSALTQLLSTLGKKEQQAVEGIILNKALEQALKSQDQDYKGLVDFAVLSNTVSKLRLFSPEAKAIRDLANAYGEIFANDRQIFKALQHPTSTDSVGAGSGLGTSLWNRLRTRATTVLFRKGLKQFSKDKRFIELRLAERAAKAIADPFDADILKSFESAIETYKKAYVNDVATLNNIEGVRAMTIDLATRLATAAKKIDENAAQVLKTANEIGADETVAKIVDDVLPDEEAAAAATKLTKADSTYVNNKTEEVVKALLVAKSDDKRETLVDMCYGLQKEAADSGVQLNGFAVANKAISAYNKTMKTNLNKISRLTKADYDDIVNEGLKSGRYDEVEKNAQEVKDLMTKNKGKRPNTSKKTKVQEPTAKTKATNPEKAMQELAQPAQPATESTPAPKAKARARAKAQPAPEPTPTPESTSIVEAGIKSKSKAKAKKKASKSAVSQLVSAGIEDTSKQTAKLEANSTTFEEPVNNLAGMELPVKRDLVNEASITADAPVVSNDNFNQMIKDKTTELAKGKGLDEQVNAMAKAKMEVVDKLYQKVSDIKTIEDWNRIDNALLPETLDLPADTAGSVANKYKEAKYKELRSTGGQAYIFRLLAKEHPELDKNALEELSYKITNKFKSQRATAAAANRRKKQEDNFYEIDDDNL